MSQASQEKAEKKAEGSQKREGATDPNTATQRQKDLADEVTVRLNALKVKNIKESRKDVGYTGNFVDVASKARSFTDLLNNRLSDKKLMTWHNKLGHAMNIDRLTFDAQIPNDEIQQMIRDVGGEMRRVVHNQQNDTKIVYYFYPDTKALKDALDMAYKLKGRYAPEKYEEVGNEYENMSTSELREKRKKLEQVYNKED